VYELVELMSIGKLSKDTKILLLKELGYDSDGTYVLKKNKNKHLDKYTGDKIKLDNMFIFPGSTIILDNNPLSINMFFEEYGDVF